MKLALIFDKQIDLLGQFGTDAKGRRVPLKALNELHEVAFSEIESDPGKGHFSREEAEEIVRHVPGYRIEQSCLSRFFHIVREDGNN